MKLFPIAALLTITIQAAVLVVDNKSNTLEKPDYSQEASLHYGNYAASRLLRRQMRGRNHDSVGNRGDNGRVI
ncbi:hypothetical protein DSO57_1007235 [Entomophthora muscae]|uniref:Uncharacterized protein n=1 Tax=Entomophthora muscae TaxID=34485 RepID=A0ACC2TIK9_9FUNG|nr:hypothetical protein DSO57_1007235 [Entomophthora muscae]